MDKQTEIKATVAEKVKEYKIEIPSNRSKLQEQFIQIETYIQEVISKQKHIVMETKIWSKMNLLSISKGAKVTRATIYNNPNTLKAYIENRVTEIEKEDLLGIRSKDRLIKAYEELKSIMEGLKINVIENHIQELKTEELESEIENITSINESLHKQIQTLKLENDKLQRKTKELTKVTYI
ncbi:MULTISPECIES: hypothetical protein [Staphylococcus]|uniref:Uncharacterized protein n=1 Tax=Staphylococcus equorum TaxID=246432 RepID=A0A9X4R1Q2_9STAP|nr:MULTISPECIES: hypothetical protein [Staphylococcus]MDG0847437.1 hypothetical protein [Staphylococcus equorum]QDS48332.1 hypothetical protein FP477_14400 [Staphylococcus aureus]